MKRLSSGKESSSHWQSETYCTYQYLIWVHHSTVIPLPEPVWNFDQRCNVISVIIYSIRESEGIFPVICKDQLQNRNLTETNTDFYSLKNVLTILSNYLQRQKVPVRWERSRNHLKLSLVIMQIQDAENKSTSTVFWWSKFWGGFEACLFNYLRALNASGCICGGGSLTK